jgi:hypothetical protein
MKETYRNEQFAVFDEVLPAPAFEAVWDLMEQTRYRSVHAFGVEGVWRPEDGNPLVGPLGLLLSSRLGLEAPPPAALEDPNAPRIFPTGTPLDHVLQAVQGIAQRVPALLGEEGVGWGAVSGNPYVYPQGTGFSWHIDETDNSGAFIYYGHPGWHSQWGGELLLADVAPGSDLNAQAKLNKFGNVDRFSSALLESGMGRYVAPLPNRVVIIAGHVPHMIAKVGPAAGNNVRASIAGFVIRPDPLRARLQGRG